MTRSVPGQLHDTVMYPTAKPSSKVQLQPRLYIIMLPVSVHSNNTQRTNWSKTFQLITAHHYNQYQQLHLCQCGLVAQHISPSLPGVEYTKQMSYNFAIFGVHDNIFHFPSTKVTARVYGTRRTRHIMGHFRDETFHVSTALLPTTKTTTEGKCTKT